MYRKRSIKIEFGRKRREKNVVDSDPLWAWQCLNWKERSEKKCNSIAVPSIAEAIMKWLMNRPVICRHFAFSLNSNTHSQPTHGQKQFFVINISPFITGAFVCVAGVIKYWVCCGQSVYPSTANRPHESIECSESRTRTAAGGTCVTRSSLPHGGVTYSVSHTSSPMHNASTLPSIFTQLIKVLFSLSRSLSITWCCRCCQIHGNVCRR